MTEALRPPFRSVVLVCRACEKRSKGPAKLSAKQAARAFKKAARDAGVPRPRVVLTACLGVCPKNAFTVVATAPGRPLAMLAFRAGDDAGEAVAVLFGEPAPSPQPKSTSSAPSPT